MQLRLFDKLHVMVLALCSKTKSIGFPSLNQDIANEFYVLFYVLKYSIKLYKLQDKYVFYIKNFLYGQMFPLVRLTICDYSYIIGILGL